MRSLIFTALVATLGCAPDFDTPGELKSLRVLAVQKDKPYARPGDTVKLTMLLSDGARVSDYHPSSTIPDAGKNPPRKVNVLWLAGCENPLADIYAGCFADLAKGGDAPSLQIGQGLEFSVKLSSDIVSRRPRPTDPKQPPYGLAYVFFAACAGEVKFIPPKGDSPEFPLACYSESGKRLDSKDFVAGYTAVFAYDRFTNANPVVKGFKFDDQDVEAECIDDDCVALEQKELLQDPVPAPDGGAPSTADAGAPLDDGGSDGSIDAGATVDAGDESGGTNAGALCASGSPLCIDRCPQGADCSEDKYKQYQHRLSLTVDQKSIEVDEVQKARSGDSVFEQSWINYYADHGSFTPSEVKLLSDGVAGYNDDHGTKLVPPEEPGDFRVWAVAHDNRGGASWARLRLSVH